MWGLFVFAPMFADHVEPWLNRHVGTLPYIGPFFSGPPMGIGMLTAGIILAIMVIPFIASVMRDVFDVVPAMLKESAYAVGATTWEVMWQVVLPYTKVGVAGGIMLGLGRALGETMAVTFVIGNSHDLSQSLLMPGNSISSALANEFNEAVGDIVHLLADRTRTDPVLHYLRCPGHCTLHALQAWNAGRTGRITMVNLYARRRITNAVGLTISVLAMLFGLFWLCWILFTLLDHGLSSLVPAVFTQMTPPPGSAGGLFNAIAGSLIMTVVGTLIGTPIGILAGTYLAEFGQRGWLAPVTRFINDVLLSRTVDRDRPVRL